LLALVGGRIPLLYRGFSLVRLADLAQLRQGMATDNQPPSRAEVLTALHELAALAADESAAEDDARTLASIVEQLARRGARARKDLEARAALTLVEDLRVIYQRVLDEERGQQPTLFPQPPTFEAVRNAVLDWATATGHGDHDALTQVRLKELELEPQEIRERGSVRGATGSARHAAIVMVEHVLGVSERTTYDRQKKGRLTPLFDDGELEAEASREARVARIAVAIEATSGLRGRDVWLEARRIDDLRLARLREGL